MLEAFLFFLSLFGILYIWGAILTAKEKKKQKEIQKYQEQDKQEESEEIQPSNFLFQPDTIDYIPVTFTDEMIRAINLIKDANNKLIFIYGRAGTGKSTFLKHIKSQFSDTLIMAPTGIAALNIGVKTIHSSLMIKPSNVSSDDDYDENDEEFKTRKLKALLNDVERIIIDECSMVRADLLEQIDSRLREVRDSDLPFGGFQLILTGDPYQLAPVPYSADNDLLADIRKDEPPEDEPEKNDDEWNCDDDDDFYDENNEIISEETLIEEPEKERPLFFFESNTFKEIENSLKFVEFTKVFRQKDPIFLEILNRCRNKTITDEDINAINSKIVTKLPENTLVITPTKKRASQYNEYRYDKLLGEERVYKGINHKNISEANRPCPLKLKLKVGTQVLFVVNDPNHHFVNGSIGIVTRLCEKTVKVKINNLEFDVEPYVWKYDKVDIYEQLPIKHGWALTIHKAQGQTLDGVFIDYANGCFAPGQAYVSLSRVRKLEHLSLRQPINKEDFIVDNKVREFMQKYVNEE